MAKNKVTTTTTVTTTVTETTVNDKPTQIVVVLDRSGSMDSIAKPTVEGLNSFIKEQKAAKGEAYMTLVQFDNEYQIDYKSKPIKEVKDLIVGETFIPRATTALFDAIGRTINELDTKDDVIFVIITDGYENTSREFNQSVINTKIEEKKKAGWNFLFLGANLDAISVGAGMGISTSNSMTYNSNAQSVNALYSTVSGKVTSFRSTKFANKAVSDLSDTLNFSEEERKDIDK